MSSGSAFHKVGSSEENERWPYRGSLGGLLGFSRWQIDGLPGAESQLPRIDGRRRGKVVTHRSGKVVMRRGGTATKPCDIYLDIVLTTSHCFL